MGSSVNVIVGKSNLSVDGSDVGFTQGGVRIRVVKDLWERPSLKGVGISAVVKLDERFIVSTYLAEPTLTNIINAWDLNTSDLSDGGVIKKGFGGGSDVTEHTLVFTGSAPGEGKTRKVGFYKVVSCDFGDILNSPSKPVIVPCSFEALLDENKGHGNMVGYIRDES